MGGRRTIESLAQPMREPSRVSGAGSRRPTLEVGDEPRASGMGSPLGIDRQGGATLVDAAAATAGRLGGSSHIADHGGVGAGATTAATAQAEVASMAAELACLAPAEVSTSALPGVSPALRGVAGLGIGEVASSAQCRVANSGASLGSSALGEVAS